jgi:hypothetical protein
MGLYHDCVSNHLDTSANREIVVVKTSVFLLITAMSLLAFAGDDKEIRYLFAGMQQERAKLRSGSYEIESVDRQDGPIKTTVIFKDDKYRLCREFAKNLKKPPVKACDNGVTIAYWDPAEKSCELWKAGAKERESLKLWDPHSAGLVLMNEPDYQKALINRLNAWVKNFTVTADGTTRTVIFTRPYEARDVRLYLTVDVDNGFTPTRYFADAVIKPTPNSPEGIESYYDATCTWEQHDQVWVPVHHRQTNPGGVVSDEHRLKWHWVNKPVDEKEFNVDALEVPATAKMIDFRNITPTKMYGEELRPATLSPETSALSKLLYAAGLLIIVMLVVWYWFRKRQRG